MADFALAWDPVTASADLVVEGNDLKRHDGLESAVLASLELDRRANPDDDIPDGTRNPRGWWGDEFAEASGDRIGSRLWLMDRGKRVPENRRLIQTYATEAFAWMLEDKVAASVSVDCQFPANLQGYTLLIDIKRPAAAASARFRYARNWDAELGKLVSL